jgi:hypothetical protein
MLLDGGIVALVAQQIKHLQDQRLVSFARFPVSRM